MTLSKRGGSNKLSYEFVKESFENEGYTLLSDTYSKITEKLQFKCPNGHVRSMSFSSWKLGNRCKLCYDSIRGNELRLDFDFVKKEIESKGYKLLSNTYKSIDSKLDVVCKNGHTWNTSYRSIKSDNTCIHCLNSEKNINRKYTHEEVKNIFAREGYLLYSNEYINTNSLLDVLCPEGHYFSITLREFNSGGRCSVCFMLNRGKTRLLDFSDVKKYIEKERYKLANDNYTNSATHLNLVCPNGHSWNVTFNNFKSNGVRCPKCPSTRSSGEIEIYKFLSDYFNSNEITSNDKSIITPFELDIVIHPKNIAIEYCGVYYHSIEKKKDENYHLNKLNLCNNKGIKLITIFEDEWVYKKDIVKQTLLYILGLSNNKSVFARKCEVREIDSSEAREFCIKNHLQGYTNALIKLGLYHNNTLVSVMTFSKSNISRNIKPKENEYELSRFCSDLNLNVVGGASKLFSYFLKTYNPSSIYSYSDKRWFNGNVYKKLGFDFAHSSQPSYWYCVRQKRYHRFNFRKSNLVNMPNYDVNKTEQEIMSLEGYSRIYDCGTDKWIFTR